MNIFLSSIFQGRTSVRVAPILINDHLSVIMKTSYVFHFLIVHTIQRSTLVQLSILNRQALKMPQWDDCYIEIRYDIKNYIIRVQMLKDLNPNYRIKKMVEENTLQRKVKLETPVSECGICCNRRLIKLQRSQRTNRYYRN